MQPIVDRKYARIVRSKDNKIRTAISILSLQSVAQTPNRADILWVLGFRLDLLPKPLDVDRQGVVADKISGADPALRQKSVTGQHLSAVLEEDQQELVFQSG